jgi:hypothetical protein
VVVVEVAVDDLGELAFEAAEGFGGGLSRAGFDGDLVSRILSSGEESLRGYGTSEEISR